MQRPFSLTSYKLDALVIAFILLIGAVHLPYPMGDDQALFMLGAQKMSQGGELYRDFWDVKQPGIYLFYLAAGKLFGFNEVGIHFLELLYMLSLSIFLIYTLRDYFCQRWMASLVPLISVGFYYGAAGVEHRTTRFFTQVEALVGFPLYLAAWLSSSAVKSPERRTFYFFSSGVAGGCVLLFKLILLPVVIAIWLTALVFSFIREPTRRTRVISLCTGAIILGVLAPLLLTAGYFYRHGTLALLLYTSFIVPVMAARAVEIGPRIGQLLMGFQWFLSWSAPLLALAFLGASRNLRPRNPVTISLVAWIFAGLFTIWIQVLSWWSYHYLLLMLPLGILAAKGIEFLWCAWPSPTRWKTPFVFASALALLCSPVSSTWAMDTLFLARHHFALTVEDRLNYQGRIDPRYDELRRDSAFLSDPRTLPGDIFVLGPYVYYLVAGRNQAIARNGESPDELDIEGWREIDSELTQALPPYIFIADDVAAMPGLGDSGISTLIQNKYDTQELTSYGTWYVLSSGKESQPCSGHSQRTTKSSGPIRLAIFLPTGAADSHRTRFETGGCCGPL
jgi:hypothetical protein